MRLPGAIMGAPILLCLSIWGQDLPRLEFRTNIAPRTSGSSVAMDNDGAVYVGGLMQRPQTLCLNQAGAVDPASTDMAFVGKLTARGDSMLWIVCMPASAGAQVAIHGDESIAVGTTLGTASVVRWLSTRDGSLVRESRVANATILAMGADSKGSLYVAGRAGAGFQTTAGAFQRAIPCATCQDGFWMKISADGRVLVSTYLGAGGGASSISVDQEDGVWVGANVPVASRHLDRVRLICSGLAGTTEKLSHGSPTFFHKKVYCTFTKADGERAAVWIPTETGEQAALIRARPNAYFKPPYVGVYGWVGMLLDQVDDEELAIHLHDAWKMMGSAGSVSRRRA